MTAGIDFALTLVAQIYGQAAAEAVQLGLEYAPATPFTSGTPDTATTEVLALVKARSAASRRERETILHLERDDFASAQPSRSNPVFESTIQTFGEVAYGHRALMGLLDRNADAEATHG